MFFVNVKYINTFKTDRGKNEFEDTKGQTEIVTALKTKSGVIRTLQRPV